MNREIIKPTSRARVLFDRVANFNQDIELSLRGGDELLIIHKQNNGWWIGKRNTDSNLPSDVTIGYFPSNYVEETPLADDELVAQGSNGNTYIILFRSISDLLA